jgi:hypothetical protein
MSNVTSKVNGRRRGMTGRHVSETVCDSHAARIVRYPGRLLAEVFQRLECVTRVSRTRYASVMKRAQKPEPGSCRQPSIALNAESWSGAMQSL